MSEKYREMDSGGERARERERERDMGTEGARRRDEDKTADAYATLSFLRNVAT